MADCPPVRVANAISKQIRDAASGTFALQFETEVIWGKRELTLEASDKISVDVVLLNWTHTLAARGQWTWTCRFHIAVRKRFEVQEQESTGDVSDDEIIQLVNLVNDLVGFFTPKQPDKDGRLTDIPEAVWVNESGQKDLDTTVAIDWPGIVSRRQFTAGFPLAYEVS